MKHIDEIKINSFLEIKASEKEVDGILEKTKQFKRLSVEESAKLLSVSSSVLLKKIYDTASYLKNAVLHQKKNKRADGNTSKKST
ncbi:hypothetical protein ATZ36_03125 [Candidatus Endomicrobiellum trichonymphae]|uniref:Uncharacterized protein n=1 Tax=Endomicrobium trichonymphae TaxID=1408204 RepID=A0A1E5ILS4_ENDTX|nr:hypothetical protein ATZ36_03125 [Candidatus Endomicrobium trichonymphae]